MSQTNKVQVVGASNISFWGLLTIVFITLKLCHVIDWSWFYVLLPLSICVSFGLLCIAVVFVGLGIAVYLKRNG